MRKLAFGQQDSSVLRRCSIDIGGRKTLSILSLQVLQSLAGLVSGVHLPQFLPTPQHQLIIYRSIPHHHSGENGEKWISYRIGIWIGTRCSRSYERKKAEIRGLDSTKDHSTESQSRAYANRHGMTASINISICLHFALLLQPALMESEESGAGANKYERLSSV